MRCISNNCMNVAVSIIDQRCQECIDKFRDFDLELERKENLEEQFLIQLKTNFEHHGIIIEIQKEGHTPYYTVQTKDALLQMRHMHISDLLRVLAPAGLKIKTESIE